MVQTHKTYGLVTGLAVVVIGLILYVADLAFVKGVQYISYLPFIIGIILNGIAFSKANDGYVKFANVFSSCFKACAIVTLIVAGWSLLSVYIFPEMVDKAMDAAREQMQNNQDMDEEQVQQALELTKKFFTPFMIGGVVFGYMFFGAIFSLIGALVAKKKGQRPPSAPVQ